MYAAHPQNEVAVTHKILWVGDHSQIQEATCELLAQAGIDVRFCASEAAALEAVTHFTPELVLLDWNTEGMDGREEIKRLRFVFPHLDWVPFILLSDHMVTRQMVPALTRSGFAWVLETPVALQTLPNVIRTTIKAQKARNKPVSRLSRPARVLHFGCTLSQAEMRAV